ncbi:MAG: YdcF family protein [bacterium]|nr:YdcF family protein [bacterium]
MIFFKILQQLLLPSVFVLVLILIGLVLWLMSKKKKLGKILMIAGLLLYYLFSTTIVSNFLLSPLESKYSPLGIEDMEGVDKVVLLLGGREADVLRGSEVLRISHLRDHEVKIIISGTDPLLSTSEEALAVKRFFINRGLEEENIIIEGRSRNTWENIRNVQEIVQGKPFFLVTSAYHMERAIKEFEKVEANPIPAPTDFKIKTEKYNVLDFLPDSQNLRKSDLALYEYFGILWYRLKY